MGDGYGLGIHYFYSPGRFYGGLIRVRGRLHIIGICRRGIFWRFGANVFQPKSDYWQSIASLQSGIYIKSRKYSIRFLCETGMKNEVISVCVRPGRISGCIHYSNTGIITLQLNYLHIEDGSGLVKLADVSDAVKLRSDDGREEWY